MATYKWNWVRFAHLINPNYAFLAPVNSNFDVTGFFPPNSMSKTPINSLFSSKNSD